MDYSNLTGGLRVQTQIPLDVKQYSLSENDLKNLGVGNNLAFTYAKGLVIYCVQEETRWEWREVKLGEENTGLLSNDFTYPSGIITFGIDYSLKSFNFFPYVVDGVQGPQGIQGIQGVQGEQGIQGEMGIQGIMGLSGPGGVDGVDGLSAYEIALSDGFVGDETAWLLSLIGPQGPQGEPTNLDFVNLQFVLNNLPSSAEVSTDLDIKASNFNFEANSTALKLENHLTSTTGNNNLIISSSNTPSGVTTGYNNIIIGNPNSLPGATNNTIILTNGDGDIVLLFSANLYQARLPFQTITGIQSIAGGKGIITLEYLTKEYRPLLCRTKSDNYNVLTTDGTIDCITNTFTVTLPSIDVTNGTEFVIKNSGTGVITIDTAGSELIDGLATAILSTQYEKIRVQYTGTNYIII